ncbi:MAG: tRNA (adenosine(37)-N6)-dimethylallyltransferase MiaA [Sphingobacteriales bacterium]|nr:MAG: tRNA (adenosine(37)-N6)-dimethylallyltransferase MiaA [Sphingobacteriales bacterium]
MSLKTALVIAGPTAVGKTSVAIQVAQALQTDILSADSRQCYQGMAIGTAQPSLEEQATIRHHFVDCIPLTTPQNAAGFETYGLQTLDRIFRKADTAVICGGTGLYLKALLHGLDPMPEVNAGIREATEAEYTEKGINWLRGQLQEDDPATFASIDSHNPARLLRALTFVRSSGKSLFSFQQGRQTERPFRTVCIALDRPREVLYERINQRVTAMLEAGLVDEVKAIMPFRELQPLQTVGYAEIFRMLDGDWTLAQATEKIAQHTRNYAKRQLTWFRNSGSYQWLDAGRNDLIEEILRQL